MSRGKKAKKKIGGRRKQDTSVVPGSIRLNDVQGSSVMSISTSHMLDRSSNVSTKCVKSLRSKSAEIVERSGKLVVKESRGIQEKAHHGVAEKRISGSRFAILFKRDELQTLRNVLQRTDLSKTPLLLGAIILGKVDVATRLLRDGYPINSRSEEDQTTALMWAVRRKDLEMINLLVRNGADLTLLDENNDNVALIAVQSASWEQNDFLDFWNSIDRKIDLKHVNTSGCTILHYARERQWDVLAKMIDKNSRFLTRIDLITKNPCFCCYCSATPGSKRYVAKRVRTKVLPPEYAESTLSHLSVLFDEIVNRYRDTWSRDRDLGYPDFRGGHGDSAATFDDLVSLRREEIARLNTVLPKLEESYLQKLRDCWSSLLAKMRHMASSDAGKFDEFVTSIQIQLLTHQVSSLNDEVPNSGFADVANKPNASSSEFIELSKPGNTSRQVGDENSCQNFDPRARVTLVS